VKTGVPNPWLPTNWAVSEITTDANLPLVTIGVLNYNRRDELRQTLDCLTKAIQYPNVEIIVVDNGSTDGSAEMVRAEFKDVTLIALEKNYATPARNFFYKQAKGKYVFSYDDDSFPATPSTVTEAVLFLEQRPEIAAISFFCYQPITGFAESGELQRFGFSGDAISGYEGLFFVEGGMCIRNDAFSKIEGYDTDFIWGAEGADLTLQLYNRGMKTIYYPQIATLHMKSQRNRNNSINIKFFTRNYLWTLAKHFPIYAAVPLSILYILRKILAMILHPDLFSGYVSGIGQGLSGFIKQRNKTKKLSLRQVIGLKRWYLFLFRW
jgi:GT2 family glycosyltransferase